MRKFKLLSLLTAAAISASCFTSLAITASAAEDAKVSYTVENKTYGTEDTITGTSKNGGDPSALTIKVANGNDGGSAAVTAITVSDAVGADNIGEDFDNDTKASTYCLPMRTNCGLHKTSQNINAGAIDEGTFKIPLCDDANIFAKNGKAGAISSNINASAFVITANVNGHAKASFIGQSKENKDKPNDENPNFGYIYDLTMDKQCAKGETKKFEWNYDGETPKSRVKEIIDIEFDVEKGHKYLFFNESYTGFLLGVDFTYDSDQKIEDPKEQKALPLDTKMLQFDTMTARGASEIENCLINDYLMLNGKAYIGWANQTSISGKIRMEHSATFNNGELTNGTAISLIPEKDGKLVAIVESSNTSSNMSNREFRAIQFDKDTNATIAESHVKIGANKLEEPTTNRTQMLIMDVVAESPVYLYNYNGGFNINSIEIANNDKFTEKTYDLGIFGSVEDAKKATVDLTVTKPDNYGKGVGGANDKGQWIPNEGTGSFSLETPINNAVSKPEHGYNSETVFMGDVQIFLQLVNIPNLWTVTASKNGELCKEVTSTGKDELHPKTVSVE